MKWTHTNVATCFCGLILLVVSGCSRSTMPAAPVEFTLDGLKFGDKATPEFLQNFRAARVESPDDRFCKRYFRSVDIDQGELYITCAFVQERLAMVFLSYPSNAYYDLLKIYTDKLGPPHEIKRGSHSESVAIWSTTAGMFRLSERDPSDDTHGSGMLESSAYEQASEDQARVDATNRHDQLKKSL